MKLPNYGCHRDGKKHEKKINANNTNEVRQSKRPRTLKWNAIVNFS